MFLNSVYVIAREMLEVSYIGCLLAIMVKLAGLKPLALAVGAALGCLGALLFTWQIDVIAGVAHGVGLDFFFLALYLLMYGALVALIYLGARRRARRAMSVAAAVILGLSAVKEVSEIALYVVPAVRNYNALDVLLAAILGLGIGLSAAIVVYFLVMRLPAAAIKNLTFVLLSLLAGGLLLQSVSLLLQAGFWPSAGPLWSSEQLLPEASLAGQLAFALFAYEATPTALQLMGYWFGVAGCLLAMAGARRAATQGSQR